MKALPCPVCQYDVPLLALEPGPMRCLHCDSVFTPPGEERVSTTLVSAALPTPALASSEEKSISVVGYRVDYAAWLRLAWEHYLRWLPVLLLGVMIFVAIVLFCAIISPGVLLFMLPLLCVLRSQLSMIAIQQIQTASFYPIPWISSSQFIRHLACEILRLLCLGVWAILAYLSLLIWVSLAVRAEWDDLLVFCGLSSTLVAITMPFVYLFVRLWFVVPLLLDGNRELDSAMAESFRLTRGHTLALGGYIAILTSLILLGVACLGVGLLVVAPFVLLAEASAYLHATWQVPRAKITP